MKKLIISLVTIACVSAMYASHKRLLITPERINTAMSYAQRDSARSAGAREIISIADKQFDKTPALAKADYIVVAYMITENEKYATALKSILLAVAQQPPRSNEEMLARRPAWRSDLGTAHRCWLAAMAYDAVRHKLSTPERCKIADGLYTSLLEPCLGDWLNKNTRIHSLNSMGHNWWTSCVCNAGLLALALRDDLPEATTLAQSVRDAVPKWFAFPGDKLQRKPRSFDSVSGGMYESVSYAAFGIQEALQFLVGWRQLHPSDKFNDIPQLKHLANYFINVCYPRTGIMYNLNFGDSHKNVCGENVLMLLNDLGYCSDSDLRWYLSNEVQGQHRDGWFVNKPMGFLFTPDMDVKFTARTDSTSCLFPDLGWATMRSSWDRDATLLAVKSGFTWNHSHADAGSFILMHKGEDIIKDAGNCWYPNPEYRNYFFQSQAHNVVLFDGKGQPAHQQYHGAAIPGSVSGLMDCGNIKYVLADATGPNADRFHRWFRHFLWIDNVIYILDDIGTYQVGELQWLWHPGGKARKRGAKLNISQNNSSVSIMPLYPRPLAYSDFVHDYPNDLWWEQIEAPTENLKDRETYWSFHLPGKTNREMALTAITLEEGKDSPRFELRNGKDWKGVRIINNGIITDIYINSLANGSLMHSNSWIEADGWTTDAYMFAVRYPEGKSSLEDAQLITIYGSAIRNSGSEIYSNLVKQSFIGTISDKKLEISKTTTI